MRTIITTATFAKALLAAGIITEADQVRRIVIDAKAGAPVVMYVERYGDERLLDVVTPLVGVEIRSAAAGVGQETPQPGGTATAEPPPTGGRRPERTHRNGT